MRTSVRDGRNLPFFPVIKEDLKALAAATEAPGVTVKLSAVRSVYFALLELANDNRSDEAHVTRKDLSAAAGVSSRTCQEATAVLGSAGLLRMEEIRGAASSGNAWTLTSPPESNRQPVPVQTGSHCGDIRQPLPVPIENGQEEEELPPSPKGDVEIIFEYWQRIMAPKAAFSDERRRTIQRALLHSSSAEIKQAIDGCAASDFHMARGEYAGKPRYTGVELILKNRTNVEKFMERAPVGRVSNSAAVQHEIKQAKISVQRAFDMPGSDLLRQQGEAGERYLRSHGINVLRHHGDRPSFELSDEPGT